MPLQMPPTNQPTRRAPHCRHGDDIYPQVRRRSFGHSSTSSLSDDDDAITPCPLEVTNSKQRQPRPQQDVQTQTHQHRAQAAGGVQRRNSWRDSIQGAPHHLDGLETNSCSNKEKDVDAETLWRRMLAVQRVFGCYNSARMRAALEMDGDSSGFIPSRTCLDLLNDSIDQLPEESKRQLEEFLEQGETRSSSATKRRSWRQRLLHGPTLLNTH